MERSFWENEFGSRLEQLNERAMNVLYCRFCTFHQAANTPAGATKYVLPDIATIKEELIKITQIEYAHDKAEVLLDFFLLYTNTIIQNNQNLDFIDKKDIPRIHWLLNQIKTGCLDQQNSYPINLFNSNLNEHASFVQYLDNNQNQPLNITPLITLMPVSLGMLSFTWNQPLQHEFTHNNLYKDLILNLDLVELDASAKLNRLVQLNQNYDQFKTPHKQIDWLDLKNEKQIEWAYGYLAKKNIQPFATNSTRFLDLIYYFNCLPTDYPRQQFLGKMQKAWEQVKFRAAGKTKKSYHLPLTKDCKKKLNKLSELMNKNENEVLEILINERYELDFLDEKGRSKY
ncbi:hypothetical protein IHE37_08235 [Acinetobacter towneri]|uniref:hypothetical protein n=1 Tax=Acinetobacter towneri TaxID=202956 RepID=UPI001F609237|nr:hypothetical protein [Acinetobacter towneri]UNT63703.1 hypothetical protein IHE37_08235 [Acinetobacter towneri]